MIPLKALLVLAALVAKATATEDLFHHNEATPASQSIVGGSEIVPGSRPYMVPVIAELGGGLKYYCSGTLISPHAVMTAAACVVDTDAPYWIPTTWVEFHRHSFFNDTGVNRVYIRDRSQCDGDVVYHPQYKQTPWRGGAAENDVAIIFLTTAITDVTPVILNEDPNVPEPGAPLDVSGWGVTDPLVPAISRAGPQAATLNYVTNKDCTMKPYKYKDHWITASMMCAIADGKSSCIADGGGPLMLGNGKPKEGPQKRFVQVGIISWMGTRMCYDPRFPSVYTRVSNVVDWVKDTVCARTGELCSKNSKSSKNSKIKKYEDTCVKFPTFPPIAFPTTIGPTVTAQPVTDYPTYMPSTHLPTWMPTEAGTKAAKVV